MVYLDPLKDPENLVFKDFPLLEQPTDYPYTQHCPLCKGHGGWNLQLNSYPLYNHEDTAENRHNYSHFRTHCMQCAGWGWVKPGSPDSNCIHDYNEIDYEKCLLLGVYHAGRCWHVYECSKCGKTRGYDSSD
jgi:hypothetical protein